MAENGVLSGKKKLALQALLTGESVRSAAEMCACSERSVTRWLADATFKAELSRLQDESLSQTTRKAVAGMVAALDCLCAIMTDERASASARVAAASRILDAGMKLGELVDLARRIDALETQLLGGEGENSRATWAT